MGSDRIDCLHLRPDFGRVPPVVELDAHSGMICEPFADESLRGRVAAVAVHNQDAFEPVPGHRIENVTHNRHVGFHPKSDRSRKRAEIRCDAVGQDRKYRNAYWFGRFDSQALG